VFFSLCVRVLAQFALAPPSPLMTKDASADRRLAIFFIVGEVLLVQQAQGLLRCPMVVPSVDDVDGASASPLCRAWGASIMDIVTGCTKDQPQSASMRVERVRRRALSWVRLQVEVR
jgi:hypothetical protein